MEHLTPVCSFSSSTIVSEQFSDIFVVISASFWPDRSSLHVYMSRHLTCMLACDRNFPMTIASNKLMLSGNTSLRWHACHSAEVNENINLGYSQDQGYS